MLNLSILKSVMNSNLPSNKDEFTRLFHGRGELYDGFKFLTVDSIGTILSITFFNPIDEIDEKELLTFLEEYLYEHSYETLLLQRRYIKNSEREILVGELQGSNYALENSLKYKLTLDKNQNSGFFADMKNGRTFVYENSKDKNVLNLFSYTCSFSVAALAGGASSVVNVDMAKKALSVGMQNHHLNNLEMKKVKFLPYNILKSFSRIKKAGPYDLVIIDPPSFQRGSFEASKDYIKIIKRLDELCNEDAVVLSCLNAPELKSDFIIDLFKEYADEFKFIKKLPNLETFKAKDEERSLKNLVFKRS